jgi:hypothetical protein
MGRTRDLNLTVHLINGAKRKEEKGPGSKEFFLPRL